MTFEEWGKENSDTRSRYQGELYGIIEDMRANWKAEREKLIGALEPFAYETAYTIGCPDCRSGLACTVNGILLERARAVLAEVREQG